MFNFDLKDLSTMTINPNLQKFLLPYDIKIQQLALKLRNFIIDTEPTCNELIWDNYNALAIAYSKSDKLKDAFCHITVYTKHVNFGFNRGSELSKSQVQLSGNGKLIRHFTVINFEGFPENKIRKTLFEAISLSEKLNDKLINSKIQSKSIVMSISEKKRRPNN
jgi:hypothetical protein